jgi:hypothetical protein
VPNYAWDLQGWKITNKWFLGDCLTRLEMPGKDIYIKSPWIGYITPDNKKVLNSPFIFNGALKIKDLHQTHSNPLYSWNLNYV